MPLKKQLKATANVLLPRSLCTCERQPAGHLSRRHVEFQSDRCCEPALVPRPQPDRRRPDPSPPHALRCQRGPLSDPGSDRTSKTPQHFCKHLCPHCVITETSSQRRVVTETCHHRDVSSRRHVPGQSNYSQSLVGLVHTAKQSQEWPVLTRTCHFPAPPAWAL